ncbi:hypothetical protein [Arthrobacter glacialis]|uniref:PPM-type phosphatase domain-containing protein n=1 Tax=Arthrobacter glacialis TaxID=1664 RepID=A0A2S4A0N0_ARTGL|nr:hypothetical protein [Arthrobacter glacialis]POH74998.1 hypothetical protein CVS27_03845 [Arthrobacter glacialis]
MTFAWDIRARVQFEGDAHVIEDSCGFNGPNAWIIDGATTLLEPLGLPAASNPQWLAHELTAVLAKAPHDRHGARALITGALAAIDATAAALVGDEHVRFPSAALSVAQLNDYGVEIASLADCTVVVRTSDGATHLVRAELADAGISAVEPVERLAQLKLDRELRNTPGRLWVARREAEAADHAHVVQLGAPELMVMATDGAWRAVDLGLVAGPAEFLARTSNTADALGLLHELRVHQGRIGEVADDATILALAPNSAPRL